MYCVEHEGCQSQDDSTTTSDQGGIPGDVMGGGSVMETMPVQDIEYDSTGVFAPYSGDEMSVISELQHPPHSDQYSQGQRAMYSY